MISKATASKNIAFTTCFLSLLEIRFHHYHHLCYVTGTIRVNSWQKMNGGEERKDREAKAGRVIGLGRAGRAIIKWMDVKHRTV